MQIQKRAMQAARDRQWLEAHTLALQARSLLPADVLLRQLVDVLGEKLALGALFPHTCVVSALHERPSMDISEYSADACQPKTPTSAPPCLWR